MMENCWARRLVMVSSEALATADIRVLVMSAADGGGDPRGSVDAGCGAAELIGNDVGGCGGG